MAKKKNITKGWMLGLILGAVIVCGHVGSTAVLADPADEIPVSEEIFAAKENTSDLMEADDTALKDNMEGSQESEEGDATRIGKSVTRMGLRYGALLGNKKNVAYSPYGLASCLGMLSGGMDKASNGYAQVLSLLNAKDATTLGQDNRAFLKQANYGSENTFKTANFLLVDQSISGKEGVKPEYLAFVGKYYDATVRTADFKKNLDGEKAQIKKDVNDITDGFIPDYESAVDDSTDVDLMNVTYFKGKWRYPFKKKNTKKKKFTMANGKTKKVQMMSIDLKEQIRYYQDKNFRAISLPYSWKAPEGEYPTAVEMVIILPKKKKAVDCVKKWNQKSVSYKEKFLAKLDRASTFNEVSVNLPRFDIDMTCDLQKNLEKLGAKDIFTGNSGITGIVKDPLYISAAVQRTKIKVDEEGTKAAAVTEFVAKCTAVAEPKEPPHYDFFCNVPFVFMVRDASGNTLFAGAVNKP
ncbi:MAG: hypothetical protein IK078_01785 [Lachnospiraceae bacterium]|nr:hypothetical protein [Lachnospiraceae bacterium]